MVELGVATPRVAPAGPPVVAVVGPTGTGKSALAVDIALRCGGEVVNADSMQVYVGMDIGTAKLSVAEQRGVPHHVMDLWPVTKAANVAEYQALARAEIERIHARGRVPILVGGSGLYVRAVLEEFHFPGHDPQIRARLNAEQASLGTEALYARLAKLDPAAAAQILPTNGRRVVRALEVIELTGGTFTAELPERRAHYPSLTLGLTRSRVDLDELIARRVVRMWQEGLVAEVAGLTDLPDSPTASRALGYRQILDVLAGRLDEDSAKAETIRATRKFARRQESWFRRDTSIRWLDGAAADLSVCAQVAVEQFCASSIGD